MKRSLIFLSLALSLGCSLFRSRAAPYPEGVIFPLEEASRLDFKGRVLRSLVKAGEKTLFSTDKGVIFCLDGRGSKVLWTYDAQSPLGCPPAVGSRSIAAWDATNTVHGLNLAGALIWKTSLPGAASSDILPAQDRLYVGTREGCLYALSQATGEIIWEFKTGAAVEAAAVAWYESVVQASTDGLVYIIGREGRVRRKWKAGAAIRVTPLVDGGRLYFGTDDASFNCLDLRSLQRQWRLPAGGRVLSAPVADATRVYFVASNTVLYAVNKRSGSIDWWRILPSRSLFRPEIVGDRILVSSASPVLVGLERTSGKESGRYDAGLEVRSGPTWSAPDILIALYDFASDAGSLARLHKQVKVELSASVAGQVAVGAEVVFTASGVGFHLPKYEFYIRRDGETVVGQEESARNSWTWYPEKAGPATIGVRVRDAREKRESELSFEITQAK